jgi:hypothetical protein
MSYDPTLDPPALPARPTGTLHIPLALIALTLAVFIASQIGAVRQQSKVMQWQLGNANKQIETFTEGEKQLAQLVEQRGTMVKQSGEIQAQFQTFLNDVLELAKDDPDTKKVVEKWKIQRNEPAAPAAGAAAAPAKPEEKAP